MKTVNIIYLVALSLLFSCKSENSKTNASDVSPEVKTEEVKLGGQSSVKDEVSDPDALRTAKSIADFSTLVAAIEAAGVEDAVVNAGPLTIFAPLNSAFDKLPAGTVEDLLKPENKSKLAFILTNHVAPANYPIQQLEKEAKKQRKLYMASGNYLPVENKEGKIFVNGIEIIKTVKVSNGWIHVIDQVLVPQE
ncbi:fasciclin domain-containing protein [Tenacibaculum tangerinum]|uniref:Fasciclin domain-containing protein n=1 Tax=Tenacibaculum tangerinum TaxID=3038772 RepID=A0ABY8L063_9FLAO|nr:fasciclin domain-containing protein [Tenacibaculum tangerinum]WGH74862.1 fasciclin domain-containing protein [Tenacibaculum tangerinum]